MIFWIRLAKKLRIYNRFFSITNGINGLIFSADEIPEEKMFDENCIVDLSRIGSSETKSLIMGMLVLKLQEYRLSSVLSVNIPLKHITILEEAHNLLKRSPLNSSAEGVNLSEEGHLYLKKVREKRRSPVKKCFETEKSRKGKCCHLDETMIYYCL